VVSAVFTAVWGFITGVFTAIGGFISGVWNTIVAVISGAVSAVWGTIVAGFSAAWGFISGVFSQVAGFLGGVWGGIVSGVSGMVGNVLGVLGGLGSQIMGVLSGAGSWLYNTGRSIVEGLISGVQSLAGNIGNAFLNMVPGWIVGPFKEALGIHSPSRVFAGFGENIGEGVLVGVGRTQSRIDDRMATLVTVPDLGSTGAAGLSSGAGVLGGSRGGSIDELIRAIREQRPIQVNGAPGMDEELLARATAEQIHWRG
jgi:phage-related protein